jgi:hypothetical protein
MELNWSCTGAVGVRQQSCWGVLWFFKRTQVSSLEKQRNWQHNLWLLITNTCANRVAIVSCVITIHFTLANMGESPFNLQICLCSVKPFNRNWCQFSCYCFSVQYIHFLSHSILFCFVRSAFVQLFVNSVLFSDLILKLYSKYFNPQNHKHQPSGKSINIMHQTAPSFVLL